MLDGVKIGVEILADLADLGGFFLDNNFYIVGLGFGLVLSCWFLVGG